MVTPSKAMKLLHHNDNTANKFLFDENPEERPERCFAQALSKACSTQAVNVYLSSLSLRPVTVGFLLISGTTDLPWLRLEDSPYDLDDVYGNI